MSSPRTPHREHAMTKDGQWKVTFNPAAPFYRVRSGKPQRLRYTALNSTSSSAKSRQPPEPESSIRVPGHVPVTRIHRDSSRCLARALAPPVCDTRPSPSPVHASCDSDSGGQVRVDACGGSFSGIQEGGSGRAAAWPRSLGSSPVYVEIII